MGKDEGCTQQSLVIPLHRIFHMAGKNRIRAPDRPRRHQNQAWAVRYECVGELHSAVGQNLHAAGRGGGGALEKKHLTVPWVAAPVVEAAARKQAIIPERARGGKLCASAVERSCKGTIAVERVTEGRKEGRKERG